LIFCDNPSGYGLWSNPKHHADYVAIIQEKASIVQLVRLRPSKQKNLYKEQIERFGTWEKWRDDRRMSEFLAKYGDAGVTQDSISPDTFVDLLARADESVWRQVFCSVQKHTTNAQMPLFFWIADRGKLGHHAVFALVPFTQGVYEHGFYTTDQRLINALRAIFEYWPLSSGVALGRSADGAARETIREGDNA
jgi:hypothetical protein